MDAIYQQLSDDIQSDVNNLYYKEVPFKDELKEFWNDLVYYQQTKKELGKGFIEREMEDADQQYWEDQQDFLHWLEDRNRVHAKLLMKLDRTRPDDWNDKSWRDGTIYCYMIDVWDGEYESDEDE